MTRVRCSSTPQPIHHRTYPMLGLDDEATRGDPPIEATVTAVYELLVDDDVVQAEGEHVTTSRHTLALTWWDGGDEPERVEVPLDDPRMIIAIRQALDAAEVDLAVRGASWPTRPVDVETDAGQPTDVTP